MATHTSEVTIQAPVERVFDALTKPELVALWQFGRALNTTWVVGSEIRFRTEWEDNARVVDQWGTVLEVRANEIVKYNLFTRRHDTADAIENYCVTSYLLTQDGEQTKVALIQEDGRPHAFAPKSLETILLSLKDVAEGN